MLRFMRTLTTLGLVLLLCACQSLLLPMPVAVPVAAPVPLSTPLDTASEPDLKTTPLFTMTIQVNAPRDVGSSDLGTRYVSYFTGGAVTGPDLRGEILANGENWYLIRLDSVAELVIQGVFKTTEGEQIAFKTLAFARLDPALMERVLSGELIDPTTARFRGVTFFTTEATQYTWLNDCVTLVTVTYDMKQVQLVVYDSGDSSRDD